MPRTKKDSSRIAKAGVETGSKMLGLMTASADRILVAVPSRSYRTFLSYRRGFLGI